jgi:endonuclease/exonuclease/phosphatase family metal-dependent hydrolase
VVRRFSLFCALLLAACGNSGSGANDAGPAPDTGGAADTGTQPSDAGADAAPAGDAAADGAVYDGGAGPANLRIVSANLTSGGGQSYDPGEGIRILQGIKPDVVLLQEFNYGANTDADARKMIDAAFGPSFSYFRESGAQIPNAVVSRWPILESGTWIDPQVQNRAFVYAKLQIPGAHPLWAVSMHLLTTSAANRDLEAQAVVAQVKTVVPAGDFLVVGGDFNTDTRAEPCIATFGAVVATAGPYPDDGHGNDFTSGTRTKPHDWVLPSPALAALQVPTVFASDGGVSTFANGLVFDSRVYTPLSDVPPVLATDSAATNMQHMAVVKDFHLQ